ncbi:hypothetical protein J6590_024101 [Homalodisca vitripennis]|nr:hypothetical protein J6590_024101 [Homalodisca vitripennis]
MSSEVSDSELESSDVDYRLVPVDSRDRCVAEVSEGNVSPLSEVKSKLNVQVSGSQVDQVGARINNHAENITFVLQVQPQEQGRLTSLVLEKLETSEAGERVSAHRNIEIIGAQFINDSPDYNKFIDIINASEEDKYLVDDRERFVSDTVTLSQKVGRHCESVFETCNDTCKQQDCLQRICDVQGDAAQQHNSGGLVLVDPGSRMLVTTQTLDISDQCKKVNLISNSVVTIIIGNILLRVLKLLHYVRSAVGEWRVNTPNSCTKSDQLYENDVSTHQTLHCVRSAVGEWRVNTPNSYTTSDQLWENDVSTHQTLALRRISCGRMTCQHTKLLHYVGTAVGTKMTCQHTKLLHYVGSAVGE